MTTPKRATNAVCATARAFVLTGFSEARGGRAQAKISALEAKGMLAHRAHTLVTV